MHKTLSEETYSQYIKTLCPVYDRFNELIIDRIEEVAKNREVKVVNIGIGVGNLEAAIYDRGISKNISIIGIDESADALAYVKARLGRKMDLSVEQGVIPNVHLPKADIYVSAMTLHHIPKKEEKRRAFDEIADALKDKGKFLHFEMFTSDDQAKRELYFEKLRDNLEPQYSFAEWMDASSKVDYFWTFTEEKKVLEKRGEIKVRAEELPFLLYEFTRT